jgi:prespore-specific regulator
MMHMGDNKQKTIGRLAMKVRQDAWTPENDLLLAETVLRHIRSGSTQIKAFDEVGDILNRTSAACGFRWNAEVRSRYEEAVQLAKKQRKEAKRAQLQQPQKKLITPHLRAEAIEAEFSEEPHVSSLCMQDVIHFLQQLQPDTKDIIRLQTENDVLRCENEALRKKQQNLQRKLEQLQSEQGTIQEDYQNLVRIMDRARKMVLFDEMEERIAPIFKMDKNGNLEIISQ